MRTTHRHALIMVISALMSRPHLVIANRRMYVRDQDLLLCYDVAEEGGE